MTSRESTGFRGYVASRPVRGQFTPQHVQNLVIRDFAQRNQMHYLLSATEYSMPECFMILESTLATLPSVDGLILFSLFMLPSDAKARSAIYTRVLSHGCSLHFALEGLSLSEDKDLLRLEDMFRVEELAHKSLSGLLATPSQLCPLCQAAPQRLLQLSTGGVSSDIRKWPRLPPLLQCSHCGTVHKERSAAWEEDTLAIYANYSAYHLADGVERKVSSSARLSPRSELLCSMVTQELSLPASGRLLDVGCGNGAFLAAFAQAQPSWSMVGIDRADSGAEAVRRMGAEFIHGDILDAPSSMEGFDLISLVHVLEHVPHPIAWLRHLATRLRPGGAILIDVPNFERNPFDLAIVDHVLHYSASSLKKLAGLAGYRVAAFDSTLIAKEHVAVLVPGQPALETSEAQAVDLGYLDRLANWLQHDLAGAKLGILGTGIAATWAAGILEDRVAFFVDEDEARLRRDYLGVPVQSPMEVDSESQILIAQPPAIAASIADRLSALNPEASWIACPFLPAD